MKTRQVAILALGLLGLSLGAALPASEAQAAGDSYRLAAPRGGDHGREGLHAQRVRGGDHGWHGRHGGGRHGVHRGRHHSRHGHGHFRGRHYGHHYKHHYKHRYGRHYGHHYKHRYGHRRGHFRRHGRHHSRHDRYYRYDPLYGFGALLYYGLHLDHH